MTVGSLNPAIIFDGDDTLWRTQILYEDAKNIFYDWMADEGWTDRVLLAEIFTETDTANVATYGFSRHRFPNSMKDVYRQMSREAGLQPSPVKLEQVGRIGSTVFERKPQLMDGARQLLIQLRRTYRLYLYTAGDPEVQERRIAELRMKPYFSAIYMPPLKTIEELERLVQVEQLSAGSSWMVGNSVKSDINPAVQLGMRGIWVQTLSWRYEEAELLPGRVWAVSDLVEIPRVLRDAQDQTN